MGFNSGFKGLKEVLSIQIILNANHLKQKVCVASLPQSYQNEPYQKLWISLLHCTVLEMNKCIVQKHMYTVQKCIYTPYIQYTYTVQVHISTSGTVIHYAGCGYQSPNLQEIHCFKWEFCVQLALFRIVQCFSESATQCKMRPGCTYTV